MCSRRRRRALTAGRRAQADGHALSTKAAAADVVRALRRSSSVRAAATAAAARHHVPVAGVLRQYYRHAGAAEELARTGHGNEAISTRDGEVLLGVALAFSSAKMPLSLAELNEAAQAIDVNVSRRTLRAWVKEHPRQLTLRHGQGIVAARINPALLTEVEDFIAALESDKTKHWYAPHTVVNADETLLRNRNEHLHVERLFGAHDGKADHVTRRGGDVAFSYVPFVVADGTVLFDVYVFKAAGGGAEVNADVVVHQVRFSVPLKPASSLAHAASAADAERARRLAVLLRRHRHGLHEQARLGLRHGHVRLGLAPTAPRPGRFPLHRPARQPPAARRRRQGAQGGHLLSLLRLQHEPLRPAARRHPVRCPTS